MALVEDVLSLENEADSVVAKARAEAKETEKSAALEIEAYRRKLAEETNQKTLAFQQEMDHKHKQSAAQIQKELDQALDAIDRIAGDVLRSQMNRIVTRFSEQ